MSSRMRKHIIFLSKPAGPDHGFMRDATQRQYNRTGSKCPDFIGKEFITGIHLLTDWLVLRWQAFDGIGYTALLQF